MRSTLQLGVALAAALCATALIIQFQLSQQPVLLLMVIAIACALAPLMTMITGKSAGKTIHSAGREVGEIKWFNASKGFGFIRRQNGEEIFVHFRALRSDSPDRRQLRDGQRVSFVVTESEKGPQAEDVETLS